MRGCPANSKGTYKSFHLFITVAQSLRRDLGDWVYASIPTDIVYSESYAAVKIRAARAHGPILYIIILRREVDVVILFVCGCVTLFT